MQKNRSIIISAIIIIGVVVLDQISKLLVTGNMEIGDEIPLIPNVMQLTHVRNRGAAFGMLADNQWVFMVFSIVAIIAMFFILYKHRSRNMLFCVSLSLLIGGGIGNMIDRVARGEVIDFFEVLFVRFAVFNIADSFLCVGVGLLLVYIIFYEDKDGKKTNNDG